MENRVLAIGVGQTAYKWMLDNLIDHLKDLNIPIVKQDTYPKASLKDARAALTEDDMHNKRASWPREVPPNKLETLVNDLDDVTALVWGFGVIVDADFKPLGAAIDELPDFDRVELMVLPPSTADPRDTPDMKYQPKKPKNRHAPFSYDPNQDYYTEPENY